LVDPRAVKRAGFFMSAKYSANRHQFMPIIYHEQGIFALNVIIRQVITFKMEIFRAIFAAED